MIDIHTHILPEVDDGSKNLETSLAELEMMEKAGTTDVIATPHFFQDDNHCNLELVKQSYNSLVTNAKKRKINLNIHLAAEVYLNDEIKKNTTNIPFISGTSYTLVESSMQGFPRGFYDLAYLLLRNGRRLILAHPERYVAVIRNPDIVEDFIHKDILLQINAGSLLGVYGNSIKNTAWKLLKKGFAHFMASDTHCNGHEYYLGHARELVAKEISREYSELLTFTNPQLMLNNNRIDFINNLPEQREISVIQKVISYLRT
ncbi:MAG: exopolysaccharide biosynthesis protein [Candidatus Cloacimonetes bacterium]|nr:exopolysaccharide biosynthesis protein [Candidatus Cloacimonadota bacterium]